MACSDNVIRAALTKKLTDINIFIRMLSYEYVPVIRVTHPPARSISVYLPSGRISTLSSCVIYDPPAKEITVTVSRLLEIGAHVIFGQNFRNAILICVQGRGFLRS